MVTTTDAPTDPRYRTIAGDGYDGVVRISFNGHAGSGALLFDGRAILTAAHLFDERAGTATVTFQTASGTQSYESSQISTHADYDTDSNNDLAIVWLPSAAPLDANRYSLYRESDEIGQSFTFIGYGQTGTGSSGTDNQPRSDIVRLKASNLFDADAGTLKNFLGSGISWTPEPGTQLIADFDSGTSGNDAHGQLINQSDLGLGSDEGLIAPGDSGGPALVNGQIAGVASYTASLSRGSNVPDVDSEVNSSFGEIAAWQRVSSFQEWLDLQLREKYSDAPTTAEEVRTEVVEGDSGTNFAYFLLEFTGVRSNPDQILSVNFATRDGTAQAGVDYIAVASKLNLYPNENKAVIPVEIIGDTIPEQTEYFFLDVSDPVGGSFGEGISKLTAGRTIIDTDMVLA